MRNSLSIVCPSLGGHEAAMTSWLDTMTKPWTIFVDETAKGDAAGFLTKCDKWWRGTDATVVGFLHADLTIHEAGWDQRVLEAFEDENVGVVGFVGATRLGVDEIYKVPYDYRQLARGDVWSNLSDWSEHGGHETGTRAVAVLDSCAVFCRHSLLDRIGGWPVSRYPNSSHCSDLWICCMAARLHMQTHMVGVAATHRSGGRGSLGEAWLNDRGGDQKLHRLAHELIYEDFRPELPLRIVGGA